MEEKMGGMWHQGCCKPMDGMGMMHGHMGMGGMGQGMDMGEDMDMKMMLMWLGKKAKFELLKEKIKKKLEAAEGKKLDEVADLVVEGMMAKAKMKNLPDT